MKLLEIFDQLNHAELSQIYLGEGLQGVGNANIAKVGSAINTGLTALHTRFYLREERIRILLQPDRVSYPLLSKYAEDTLSSTEDVRFIQGSYGENLLKIEQVLTDSKCELKLNDRDDKYSIHTPSMNVIVVPEGIVKKDQDLPDKLKTDTLEIVYRANHPMLNEDVGLDDAEDYEIELPYSHLQALLYFVASRLHNPTGMSQQFHMGNSYAAKYEMECQRLELDNFQIDRTVTNHRLIRNGWV